MFISLALFTLIISPLVAEISDRASYETPHDGPHHATFGDSRNYPCILDTKCQWTKGPHPVITEVQVDYYGDLGEQIIWTRSLFSAENITSCEEATKNFPHPFIKQCEGPIVTPATMVVDEPFPID